MSVLHATCASCGAMLGAVAAACRSCGVAVPPARHPLFGAIAREPRDEAEDGEAPIITARDFMVLEELARLRLHADSPAARGLIETLERCRVVVPDKVEADIVTLDSRVLFSINGGAPEERVLVLPNGHGLQGWSLPVTTPRGLAMLGRRAGTTVWAERHGGMIESIDILSLAFQPEEATRRKVASVAGAASAAVTFLRRPAGVRHPGEPPRGGEDPPPAA